MRDKKTLIRKRHTISPLSDKQKNANKTVVAFKDANKTFFAAKTQTRQKRASCLPVIDLLQMKSKKKLFENALPNLCQHVFWCLLACLEYNNKQHTRTHTKRHVPAIRILKSWDCGIFSFLPINFETLNKSTPLINLTQRDVKSDLNVHTHLKVKYTHTYEHPHTHW